MSAWLRLAALVAATALFAPAASAGTTEFLSLPSAAFTATGTTYPTPNNLEQRIGYLRSFDGAPACAGASVHLPDGALVQRLIIGITDSDTTADVGVELRRRRVNSSGAVTAEALAAVTSQAAPGVAAFETTSIAHPLVDNDLYAYFLVSQPCPRNLLALRGVILEFAPDVGIFSDDFESGDTAAWTATVTP